MLAVQIFDKLYEQAMSRYHAVVLARLALLRNDAISFLGEPGEPGADNPTQLAEGLVDAAEEFMTSMSLVALSHPHPRAKLPHFLPPLEPYCGICGSPLCATYIALVAQRHEVGAVLLEKPE